MNAPQRLNHYLPLFGRDFIADTRHLTCEQDGAYLNLLLFAWHNGPLPDNPAALARICKVSLRVWHARIAADVMPFWNLTPAGWVQSRLEAERQHVADLTRKRVSGGVNSQRIQRIKKTGQPVEMPQTGAENGEAVLKESSSTYTYVPVTPNGVPGGTSPPVGQPRDESRPSQPALLLPITPPRGSGPLTPADEVGQALYADGRAVLARMCPSLKAANYGARISLWLRELGGDKSALLFLLRDCLRDFEHGRVSGDGHAWINRAVRNQANGGPHATQQRARPVRRVAGGADLAETTGAVLAAFPGLAAELAGE